MGSDTRQMNVRLGIEYSGVTACLKSMEDELDAARAERDELKERVFHLESIYKLKAEDVVILQHELSVARAEIESLKHRKHLAVEHGLQMQKDCDAARAERDALRNLICRPYGNPVRWIIDFGVIPYTPELPYKSQSMFWIFDSKQQAEAALDAALKEGGGK